MYTVLLEKQELLILKLQQTLNRKKSHKNYQNRKKQKMLKVRRKQSEEFLQQQEAQK